MASLHMKIAVSMVDSLEDRESENTERKRAQSEEEQVFFLKFSINSVFTRAPGLSTYSVSMTIQESAWPLYIFSFYDNLGERMASLHVQLL
jgi:hypothetical protein